MLTKGIVTKEKLILRDVAHHAVRPVGHGNGHEAECLTSKLYLGHLLRRGDGYVPIVLRDYLLAPFCGDDLRLRRLLPVEPGQAAGVVGLGVVADYVIDLARVHYLLDVTDHGIVERRLHCVDECDLVRYKQVRVVCRAPVCDVAMEVPDVPVYGTHPVDSLFKLDHNIPTASIQRATR